VDDLLYQVAFKGLRGGDFEHEVQKETEAKQPGESKTP
jgi:hypothetical protein